MSTVIVAPDKGSAIIPKAQYQAVIALDDTIQTSQREIASALKAGQGSIAAFVQAKAMQMIDSMITPEIMADIKFLMNTPLGFKTDRPATRWRGGREVHIPAYSDDEIRRCTIVALLKGARLCGNEFNILAGNYYLTKEFYEPRVKQVTGLTELKIQIGIPTKSQTGDLAFFPAIASWKLHGKEDRIEWLRSDAVDMRIAVKNHESSSIDELRGRATSKIYRQIYERVTGINLEFDNQPTTDTSLDTLEGEVVGQPREQQIDDDLDENQGGNNCNVEPAMKPNAADGPSAASSKNRYSDAQTARNICDDFISQIEQMDSINDVNAALNDRLLLVKTAEWSQSVLDSSIDVLKESAQNRLTEIRSSRGEASNTK